MKNLMLVAALLATTLPVCAAPYVTATYFGYGPGYHFDFVVQMEDPTYGEGSNWGLQSAIFTDPVSPTGWSPFIDFRSIQWGTNDHRIPAGGYMGGFAAWATSVPSTLDYFVGVTGPGPSVYRGTLVPQAIPEPASFLGIASALMALGALGLRVKRR